MNDLVNDLVIISTYAIKEKTKTDDQWHSYIGTSLRKTAEATLDTAKRVAEYRLVVKEDVFNKSMKDWFGFSPSHLSYWGKIAESFDRFNSNTSILPSSPRTLYELSGIEHALWDELVETGDVNPSVTVEGAKSLKINGGFKKATARKYGEADNFLEIMQKLDQLMAECNTVKDAKALLGKWLTANPPEWYEEEKEEEVNEVLEHSEEDAATVKEVTAAEVKGTSSQTRVKCLALFGIFVDKPIYDKDILTCLDQMAGSDETKLAAIATLESE